MPLGSSRNMHDAQRNLSASPVVVSDRGCCLLTRHPLALALTFGYYMQMSISYAIPDVHPVFLCLCLCLCYYLPQRLPAQET